MTTIPARRAGVPLLLGACCILAGCAVPAPSGNTTATPSAASSDSPTAVTSAAETATPLPTRNDPPATSVPTDLPTVSAGSSAGAPIDVVVLNGLYDPSTGELQVTGMLPHELLNGTCRLVIDAPAGVADASGPLVADAQVSYCAHLAAKLPAGLSAGSITFTLSVEAAGRTGSAEGRA